MRIRLKKSDLLPACSVVQSVANQQSTLPILSNVLITTEHDNVVVLAATDYETRVRIEVPAEVDKKGSCTVPAKTFYDLVKELPEDGEVQFEAREKGATMKCREIRCDLATMPWKDFPRWPEMDQVTTLEIPQKDLKRVLEKILFAVPIRDPRKVLLGALMEFRDNKVTAVATDGKILAYCEAPLPSTTEKSIIVPHKILDELNRNISNEGNVRISFDDKQIGFEYGNVHYVSNQIEGKYPNFEAVVPKEFSREFRFQKPPMLSAIRRASILTDIKNSAISMEFSGDIVTIEAESYDKGRIHEEVPGISTGEDFKIVFNYKFIAEVLKSLDREEVVLQANQPTTPAVFRASEGSENFYLVMPIKLTEMKDLEDDDDMSDRKASYVPPDDEGM